VFRKAEPGDCFLLFVPSAEELNTLQALLDQFQKVYGGFPVQVIHLTCQRFTLKATKLDETLEAFHQVLCQTPFPLIADNYNFASSRFTEKPTLSWELNENSPWYSFREKVNDCLRNLGMMPHYTNLIKGHFTLLYEISRTHFDEELNAQFPKTLFEAKTLKMSRMNEARKFDELGRFDLQLCTGD